MRTMGLLSPRAKAEMVRQYMESKERLLRQIELDQVRVIESIMSRGLSLRAVARQAGLSPTYVCRVRQSDVRISPSAYLSLVELEDRITCGSRH